MLAGIRHWQASRAFKAIPRDERCIMIAAGSGAGMDHTLGLEKPVLYIDVPVKAHNDDAGPKLEIEPFESFIPNKIGSTLSPDDLYQVGAEIQKLRRNPNASQQHIGGVRRTWIFNYGTSAIAATSAKARARAIQEMLTRTQARCPTTGDST